MKTTWPENLPASWLSELSERFGKCFSDPELLHQAENASWLLRDDKGQVLVFKLYRPTPAGLERLGQEIDLLARLQHAEFRAPIYLKDVSGRVLQRFESFHATLQPAIQGLMWIHPEPKAYEVLGRSLRQLQALSPKLWDLPLRRHDFETLLGESAWQPVLDAPFAPPELKAELNAWREQLRAEFDFGGDCLVHSDAHWGNVIVTDESDTGLCLIDWEEAGWGNPLLDLATVEIHLQQSPERKQILDALYRGYGKTPDREQLNRAMAVRLMWLLTQIPTRLDIPELSDPLGVFMRYKARFQKLLGTSES